jgi:hypothetical protein
MKVLEENTGEFVYNVTLGEVFLWWKQSHTIEDQ